MLSRGTVNTNVLVTTRLLIWATGWVKVPAKTEFLISWPAAISVTFISGRVLCRGGIKILHTEVILIGAPPKIIPRFRGTVILIKCKDGLGLKTSAFYSQKLQVGEVISGFARTLGKKLSCLKATKAYEMAPVRIVIHSHWEPSLPNGPGKDKIWEEASPTAATPES